METIESPCKYGAASTYYFVPTNKSEPPMTAPHIGRGFDSSALSAASLCQIGFAVYFRVGRCIGQAGADCRQIEPNQ